MSTVKIHRRDFLRVSATSAAGLVLGFALPERNELEAQFPAPPIPRPNAYIRIAPDETVTFILKNPGTELRLCAQQASGTALVSPISGEMTGKINESLQATIQVELLERGHRIFEDTGRNAGLEVAGEIEVLKD